ncbi:MAG: hypothetical protein ACTHMF_18385 [Leifsonia sp.]|uniref:hypothetical protein n=1 Tax=Leifsonia sp. TaxID=1870902 RepID=UPI003F80E328
MALGLIDRLRRRRDPMQVSAREHIYPNHRDVEARLRKFLDAPRGVQRQVLIELYAVAVMREPGARGPAMVAIIAALAAAGTLLCSFFVALLASMVAKTPADAVTGDMTERSFRVLESALNSNLGLVVEVCVVLLITAALAWVFALLQDHERTQARVWIHIYEDALQGEEDAQSSRAWSWWELWRGRSTAATVSRASSVRHRR